MIAENSIVLFAYSLMPKDLLKRVLIARKGIKSKTAVYLAGLVLLAREGSGMRELRTVLSANASDHAWYRMAGDLKGITADLDVLRPREWYDQITQELKRYKPFRVVGKSACGVNKSKV